MNCPSCKSEKLVKNGVVWGKQRYKCKNCNKKYRDGARAMLSKDLKVKIIKAYLNGTRFRAASRIFDVPLTTVFYFIKKLGQKLEDVKKKEVIQDKDIIYLLEADELFTNLGKKNKSNKNMDSSR